MSQEQPHEITTAEVEANIGVTEREIQATLVTGLTAALMKIHQLEAQVQQLQWDLEDQAANFHVPLGSLADRIADLEDHSFMIPRKKRATDNAGC